MLTLEDIIEKLEKGKFNNLVYVGKNYSKQDLIDELKEIVENKKKVDGTLTGSVLKMVK